MLHTFSIYHQSATIVLSCMFLSVLHAVPCGVGGIQMLAGYRKHESQPPTHAPLGASRTIPPPASEQTPTRPNKPHPHPIPPAQPPHATSREPTTPKTVFFKRTEKAFLLGDHYPSLALHPIPPSHPSIADNTRPFVGAPSIYLAFPRGKA